MKRWLVARPIGSYSWHLVILLVLLANCVTPARNIVLLRESADPRLATTVKERLFFTMARIGDREARPFLIDTGASSIVLDTELGKTVTLSSWIEADHPDFKQKVKWGTLAALEVGPINFQNTDVVVMDLSLMSTLFEERLAGVLGRPLFAEAVIEVDLLAGSVACFDPKTYRLPKGEWAPLTLRGGRPFIAARLDKDIVGPVLLDTGSNFAVLFHPEFIRHHALLNQHETHPHKIVSWDGWHDTLRAKIAWFEFGGRRFERPVADFATSEFPMFSEAGIAGIIGQDLLQHFLIVFNYPESKIALVPR